MSFFLCMYALAFSAQLKLLTDPVQKEKCLRNHCCLGWCEQLLVFIHVECNLINDSDVMYVNHITTVRFYAEALWDFNQVL